MTIKVAINGYGRICRNVLRAFYALGKRHIYIRGAIDSFAVLIFLYHIVVNRPHNHQFFRQGNQTLLQ